MLPLKLPRDLTAFLKAGKQLKYNPDRTECGQVTMLPLEKLKVRKVAVEPVSSDDDDEEPVVGHYVVPAVALVKSEDYNPDFVMVWLPDLKLYGSWDCDHHEVTVFPKATWTDITASPVKYLNGQWEAPTRVAKSFDPAPHYRLTKRRKRDTK